MSATDANAPAWAAMSFAERTEWMQATISQAVTATLGRTLGLEEPLMTAGLDSLGTALSLVRAALQRRTVHQCSRDG